MTRQNEEWISVNRGVHVVGVETSVDMPAYDRFKGLLHQVDAIAVGLDNDTDRAYISIRHDDQFFFISKSRSTSSGEENMFSTLRFTKHGSMFKHTSDLFNNGAIVSFSRKSSVIHDS